MERRPEEVAEVKSRRGTTLERHFQITKHSHRLYLLRHKILSADLQRLQTYKAPREGPLQSPDPEGPTTDPFRGSEPAAARAPTGSNRRARHSPAANRRRAAHLPRAPADRLCSAQALLGLRARGGADAAGEDGAGERGPHREGAAPRVSEAAPSPREHNRVRPAHR